jgi:DNA-binding NarL/FixJ family response regulator
MAMRVFLVGSPPDRARVRGGIGGALQVAGEFDSLAAAQAHASSVDAIVVAEPAPARSDLVEPRGDVVLDDDDGPLEPLTPREIQVLELLAEGLPNKAIALRLRISDQTVKFHVSSISGKLGAANRTDAVRRAVRRGLITL